MKGYSNTKILQNLLLFITVVLILISFLTIIVTLISASAFQFSPTTDGLAFFFSLFEPYLTLIVNSVFVLTAYIAIQSLIVHTEQLKLNKSSVEGKSLLELRILFNSEENTEIHKNLRGESGLWANGIPKSKIDDPDVWRKVDNYLGILELINIQIKKGVISEDNFHKQFGYRLDNVVANKDILNYLNSYTDEKGKNIWVDLFELINTRKVHNEKNT